jgi:S-adenosylmethionine:tRNA ribosyltransferase-isomerase
MKKKSEQIEIKTSFLNFKIPSKLIVEYPSIERDEARLMVVHRKTGKIEHKLFKDMINYFDKDDVIILNNTKVFPAILYGYKEQTKAKIKIFLLRELDKKNKIIDVLVDPARKIRIGNKIFFSKNTNNNNLVAEVIDNTTSRGRILRFLSDLSYEEFKKQLFSIGKTPLPNYIKREVEKKDIERYQTIYAKEEGAVVAPAAGLHFSKHLLKKLEIKGISLSEITLHIGLCAFSSIEVEDLSKYKMDSEKANIKNNICKIINTAIFKKKRICAVGNSVMRTLESSLSVSRHLNPFDGWTNKFIYPPYKFSIANSLISNFHMPKSASFVMIAAFMGYDLAMKTYQNAIKEKYRFYSYGDAMLIL